MGVGPRGVSLSRAISVFDNALIADAKLLLDTLRERSLMLATAESCTGGLIAGVLTEVPGASTAFDRGFVTYSNDAKIDMLGVPAELIICHGAVSEDVVRAMALGALVHSDADVAIAVTGIAGPDGGTSEKPVGLVHMAVARLDGPTLHLERRYTAKDRATIRLETVRDAIGLALDTLEQPSSTVIE